MALNPSLTITFLRNHTVFRVFSFLPQTNLLCGSDFTDEPSYPFWEKTIDPRSRNSSPNAILSNSYRRSTYTSGACACARTPNPVRETEFNLIGESAPSDSITGFGSDHGAFDIRESTEQDPRSYRQPVGMSRCTQQ